MSQDDANNGNQQSAKSIGFNPKPNPLGNLSSYTYGLSLYMVNTDVMNKFIASGGSMAGITGSTPGVRVVAQSGGLSATDKALKTIDGTRIEYYIDDLNLTTYLPGGPQKATASTTINFRIVEPIGFAFLQDLTRAGFELNAESSVKAPYMNGIQQHFIIGMRFYGYDVNGNVITQVPLNPKGDNPDSGALPERFFSIKITKVKFKLDGKIVNYQCESVILAESIANGQVNGLVKSTTTLTGATVGEVLADPTNKNSLVSILNAATQTSKDNKKVKFPTKYAIEFIGDDGKPIDLKNSEIAKQKLMSDATFDSKIAETYPASSAERSTIAQSFKANTIDTTAKSIQLGAGQTVLTVIDSVITKSDYLTQALTEISKAGTETTTLKNSSTKTLSWYSVNPVVKVGKEVDDKTNDWSYEITYQIRSYRVPYVRTVTANVTSTYPGPSKQYNYWLTGLNSEIISYEQVYDNLYYVMTVASNNTEANDANTKTKTNTGSAPVHESNAQNADKTGSENKLFQYQENVVAQLYSPGEQSRAKIRIMGDPDYIMSKTGVNGASALGNRSFQIDPLSGQVFIEIVFQMASDYDERGLVNVSGNIQFYGSEVIKDLPIKGVVYQVIRVDSVFAKGSFIQTLDCVLVDQTRLTKPVDKDASATKAKVESSGNQRAESPKVVPGVTLNSNAGAGRGSTGGATAAEFTAYQNNLRVDLRTPQSSTAKGQQSLLNPAPITSKPTLTQLQNSQAFRDARLSGMTGQAALDAAETAFNDDQIRASQTQTPQLEQRNTDTISSRRGR